MTATHPSAEQIAAQVRTALAEDIGTGDLTALLIAENAQSRGSVISRDAAVLAGCDWFSQCLCALDPTAQITWQAQDGQAISPDQVLCTFCANSRAVLTAERTALNFLQTLSAVASQTRRYVDAVAGTGTRIVDTRKTLPGLRLAEKYAVRCGGGENHRCGLYDGILIKENHIIAAGGIIPALARAQAVARPDVFIQIEVESLAELETALAAGARMVLLDNMDLPTLRAAVAINAGRAQLEASGNIDLGTVRAVAQTGVDRISIGDLTKNIQAIDLSLRHDT